MNIDIIKTYLLQLQQAICQALEQADDKAVFKKDEWNYPDGDKQLLTGNGCSRVIENGTVFEKGGINFSHVQGKKMPAAATQARPELKDAPFQAMGVSLVLHPNNPYLPTTHANFRFFMANEKGGNPIWWFGGGLDLTPYYPFLEDCVYWHQTAKAACDPFGKQVYPAYKKWCDDYFYLKHRNETRGIGGLFFDDLNSSYNNWQWDFDTCFSFMKSVGDSFLKAYMPIVKKRKAIIYTEQQKDFQRYRRGRYVEFNLVYDRGTIFGLQSGGRTESILMSLPPEVTWKYNWQPQKGTAEAELYDNYLQPREWLG